MINIPQFLVYLELNMALNDAAILSDNRATLDRFGGIGLCIQLQREKTNCAKNVIKFIMIDKLIDWLPTKTKKTAKSISKKQIASYTYLSYQILR